MGTIFVSIPDHKRRRQDDVGWSRVWKRMNHVGTICVSILDRKRRRRDQDDVENVRAQIRTGVG